MVSIVRLPSWLEARGRSHIATTPDTHRPNKKWGRDLMCLLDGIRIGSPSYSQTQTTSFLSQKFDLYTREAEVWSS